MTDNPAVPDRVKQPDNLRRYEFCGAPHFIRTPKDEPPEQHQPATDVPRWRGQR